MRTGEFLTVLHDAEGLVSTARIMILAAAMDAKAQRRRFDFALSGGSTPRALYETLAREEPGPGPLWHLWFGDERCVPPEHPDSNFGMARATGLLARVPPENVHRMRGEADPEAEAARYAAELCAALGTPPRLDLVLLGLGLDGHTASLFPGTPALDAPGWVSRGRAPVAPAERLTLTFETLATARGVLFLVSGPDKASVLERVLAGRDPTLPAARVHPRDGNLSWVVERSAHPHGFFDTGSSERTTGSG